MITYSPSVLDYFFSDDDIASSPLDYAYHHRQQLSDLALRVDFYADITGARFQRVAFQAQGCVATIALAAFVAKQLQHAPMTKARELDYQYLMQALHLPQMKQHCAILVSDALSGLMRSLL